MKKKIIPLLLLFLGVIILAVFLFVRNQVLSVKEKWVEINQQKVFVQIAETEVKRAQGLSGIKSLPENEGILFLFEYPGLYPFTMRGMFFNLDLVFINGDKVVDTAENVQRPENNQEPQKIFAKREFDKVLEVNGGVIKKLNIHIGDSLLFHGVSAEF